MNRLLAQRREALIAQAASQRGQLAYAFSGITHRLRLVDRGLDWLSRGKYSVLLAAIVLGAGFGISRQKPKLFAVAAVLLQAIRIFRTVWPLVRTTRTVDLGQRISQRTR